MFGPPRPPAAAKPKPSHADRSPKEKLASAAAKASRDATHPRIVDNYELKSSTTSVKRALGEMKCRRVRPRYRPGLSTEHLKARLKFAIKWKCSVGNTLEKFKQHVWIDYKWFYVLNRMRTCPCHGLPFAILPV